ncbi:MAG: NADH-quinone oxidoreductase subunit C [Acidimicrobiaceae bacterium]|nr:NADH-quinone oxidoreductase subunit C [Acidimicrobiaceae bacterium]|tara:strand:+ start:1582 stop:2097 length:516 start_codon:yes stop_codon:yes gene_type:complete
MSDSPPPVDDTTETVEKLYDVAVTNSKGQTVLHPSRDSYHDLIQLLVEEGYEVCVDLCGADYLGNATRMLPMTIEPERFELVVNLLDVHAPRRLRIRVQVPESDLVVRTISDVHPGAEAMERETNDMFGVCFEGHPDPTPILLPDGWKGHPLRKDFAMGNIPVQFKAVEGR